MLTRLSSARLTLAAASAGTAARQQRPRRGCSISGWRAGSNEGKRQAAGKQHRAAAENKGKSQAACLLSFFISSTALKYWIDEKKK